MSRLNFVPPHLMDMPSIAVARVVPPQGGIVDPFALSADLPVYNADFSGWNGQADGVEQSHEADTHFDFDNYYSDEEFWGAGLVSGSVRLIRKGINAAGQLATLGTYSLPVSGFPNSIANQKINTIDVSQISVVRLNKTTLVLGCAPYYTNGAYYASAIAFVWDGTAFTVSKVLSTSGWSDGSGAYYGLVAQKVTDNILIVAGYDRGNQQTSYVSMWVYNLSNNTASAGGYSILSTDYFGAGQFHPLGAGRFVHHGYTANTETRSAVTVEVSVPYQDGQSVNPGPGVGTAYGVQTADGNQATFSFLKPFILLSSTRSIRYAASNTSLYLEGYSAGQLVVISSLQISSLLAANQSVLLIARLSNNEFLIVYADSSDVNLQRCYTQRVFVNADNSMTLGPRFANWGTAPYKNGGPWHGRQHPKHRGLVLPGNRVLMQARRVGTNETTAGSMFTKLLRAA